MSAGHVLCRTDTGPSEQRSKIFVTRDSPVGNCFSSLTCNAHPTQCLRGGAGLGGEGEPIDLAPLPRAGTWSDIASAVLFDRGVLEALGEQVAQGRGWLAIDT